MTQGPLAAPGSAAPYSADFTYDAEGHRRRTVWKGVETKWVNTATSTPPTSAKGGSCHLLRHTCATLMLEDGPTSASSISCLDTPS